MIYPAQGGGTRLVLDTDSEPERLPVARWLGVLDGAAPAPTVFGPRRGVPLLLEHSRGSFLRPGLRGHRLAAGSSANSRDIAGRSWSTAFVPSGPPHEDGNRLAMTAADLAAGLELRTDLEALPGGALRIRHVLTNAGSEPYLLEALEVAVPLPDWCDEILDFTGRHERERSAQRHPIQDGVWLRESRGGRPGLDSPTMLIAGTAGFGFGHGRAIALAVAASGNSTMSVQRSAAEGPMATGGELFLPGELVLRAGEWFATPWIFVVASDDGLDSIAAALHTWQRTLPAHPGPQSVTLNVWEAVYFNHDVDRLTRLADLAAQVGVERFVLDDGWFRGRRNARAGLGDWTVDRDVWPDGLTPLIDAVHRAGMQFGLWFEPEMVNPDSELFRANPDWVLSAGERLPTLQRNQLVVDLTNRAAYQHVLDQLDAVLTANAIDYVKWDHNRELLEAGSSQHGYAPAAHQQEAGFYGLLDELRRRHPDIDFESCASGGGRIDLGVIQHVQRVWTSDMTDALSRQLIQRWTVQLVAPEYLGAHVSAPSSHQTGRELSLDFRAATALFGSFGIEWDLAQARPADLERLAEWVALYKRWRPLLHSGRVVRLDVSDPAVIAHGVLAADRHSALIAHVQLDESTHNRGVVLRVPGLDPATSYRCTWLVPPDTKRVSGMPAVHPDGPTAGAPINGADLVRVGLWIPRRRPEQVLLIEINATGA
ncbi:MAG TPA: alpha-galactosidase [Jatrophihabitantaceae bacterium]|nr:alpha-galactosidase [Jatrophihabitantaceae bacterium]